MSRIYEIYAEAVSKLAKQIDIEKNIVAPVGFGGAAAAELVMYCFAPKHDGSVFQNTFYASSKVNSLNEIKIDVIKLADILFAAHQKGSDIVYLDERAKTGRLGEGLRKKTRDWEERNSLKVNSIYAVLFDPALNADKRGLAVELSNKQRLEWASEEAYKKFIVKENGGWLYNIEPSKIKNLNHIHDIKMEIDSLLFK